MNLNQIEGKWKQVKGNAKEHWGNLIDDPFYIIDGKRDKLEGKIQIFHDKRKHKKKYANQQLVEV